VLRAVERATAAPARGPDVKKRELIVLVGGYASNDDAHVFDTFRARVARDSGYDLVRFGQDLGAYDTLGAVDANATQLRDTIRSLSTSYDSVHIVTHSMGGVVADRAFALGLSANDGVTTYVAWAAPHDGAHAARALQSTLAVSGAARADTRTFTATYLRDPDSSAVRDMARSRASGPPPGVARLDLRLATDALVSTADARDPGVASRVLLPGSIGELEGHGGILSSEEALDLTMATIRKKAVPADDRGVALRAASDAMANSFDHYAGLALVGVCGLCLLGGIGALVRRSLRRWVVWPPLSE
jgi:pimeloyl-ACP methyl ester carboxylesterase